MQEIVTNKMYWTRDILAFFKIEAEDVHIFLNFHQVYKFAIMKEMNKGNQDGKNLRNVTARHGSYFIHPNQVAHL